MIKQLALAVAGITLAATAWAESASSGTETGAAAETVAEGAAALSLAVEDRDLDAAENIFKKTCRACHGNKAQGVSSYPSLSDKEPDYLVEKMEIYRSGEKIGPNSILMIQHAKKLSDEDIANLAVYVTTAFE